MAALSLLGTTVRAAHAPPADWVNISDPVINKVTSDGKKQAWPGQTAGVVCDPASGDLFLVVPGHGLWKSADHGATFERIDGEAVGGRCETAYGLNMDPAGKRLACFMLDGNCAVTPDGGKTWQPMASLGRNWDYAAVDWSGESIANILGERHEVGGEVYLSNDAGTTWKLLFKDAAFDRAGCLGIIDARTLLRAWPKKGIERSTDAGQTWVKTSDLQPTGKVMKIHHGTAWWLAADGLLTSRDQGLTWQKTGTDCPGTIGPLFDPGDDKHLVVAGAKGIFETADAGATWKLVAPLPPKFDVPQPGWFTNVAWDPGNHIFYTSRMGQPAFRFAPKKP